MSPSESSTPAVLDESALEFSSLRKRGITLLQSLTGSTWTDHNAHDPGITILETLCYALTDLAYRADFSIPDLLADARHSGPSDSLFTAAEILTGNPVTPDDWRKLVLDVDGVRNAWVEPVDDPAPHLLYDPGDETLYFESESELGVESHRTPLPLRGVYRVLVDKDPGVAVSDEILRGEIDRRLHAHRNVGEDFEPAIILAPQLIVIDADIEVGDVRNPQTLLGNVYGALQEHLSPRVPFHSLEEMLDRRQSLDEIFNGPRLDHGFIDTAEMRQTVRRTDLWTSDVIAALMKVEGVKAIHHVTLGESKQPWSLPLAPDQTPVLAPASRIRFFRDRVTLTPPASQISAPAPLPQTASDRPLPVGRDRQIDRYRSIQHDLPQAFGVGRMGLPADATPLRQAQARQLAAYLAMFDRVLAGSFSQLAHARTLVSFAPGPHPAYPAPAPSDAPRAAEVLDPAIPAANPDELFAHGAARSQRFLAHLLARFAEDFQDLIMVGAAGNTRHLEAQRAFLRDYPLVSGGRAHAFDLTRPSWGEEGADNVSGLELRIARKLGLPAYSRQPLKDLSEDGAGFHLIEHILLRPAEADKKQWPAPGDAGWRPPMFLASTKKSDPYSAQLTFVFPDWIKAFRNHSAGGEPGDFRSFIEKTVREETPAHLSARVLWLDRETMSAFEDAYRTWLEAMARNS